MPRGKVPTSFSEASSALGSRERKSVAHATYLTKNKTGDVDMFYHETPVVTYHQDNSKTLRTGGWKTATTKRRINAALGQVPGKVSGGIQKNVYSYDPEVGHMVVASVKKPKKDWTYEQHTNGQSRSFPFAEGMNVRGY